MTIDLDGLRIVRWSEIAQARRPFAEAGIDAIFFAASSVQSFADEGERRRFRERWLGRYLDGDPDWTYLALDRDGKAVGYVAGAVDDPALAERFSDIAYFKPWAHLTAEYPAHLHINVAGEWRSAGLGRRLIEAFAKDARAGGVRGVHVVTGEGMRNVGFYLRNGFKQLAALEREGKASAVFLGRRL